MIIRLLRRLRHVMDLPEAPLEEIQRRYRPAQRQAGWEPCPHCKSLVRGAHKCKVGPPLVSPESLERLRVYLVAADIYQRERATKSKKVLQITRRRTAA